ncbi:MAG: bifunctional adenosylcobinamide kinase/adenosylcobinamide-phosphate guanylyltransferase [Syntrophorhabdus sp.]
MRRKILILGGARSGKSSFALAQASAMEGRKAFVATAEALDHEMNQRIANHKKERGKDWDTFEESVDVSSCLRKVAVSHEIIIVDCLTLWVSNIMMRNLHFNEYMDGLLDAIGTISPARLYIVSNEVGLGLVPENQLGRYYRDNLGLLNMRVAALATDVFFMTAGIPLQVKGSVQ